ncbi:hypothetical protein DL771_003744 [Monosporascus sp. 5C6A]|nr:hypothetical protein DL771_003744 [Monosporascus sp. 5C6A]
MRVPLGRVLGGSSAINTLILTPPSEASIDAWARLGNPGWEFTSSAQSMARAYNWTDSPWENEGYGPLQISVPKEDEYPLSGRYYGAVMTPESDQLTSKQRSFVGSAYLKTARSRANLTIWTQTLADKMFSMLRTVRARKETIISAGTFHSPKILELSGIGDANILRSLDIDVVIDNPHVGENLQSHPYCTMAFEA